MRVLFYSVNGIGLGHINRTSIIAKEIIKINPKTKIDFVTKSKFSYFLDNAKIHYTPLPCGDSDKIKKEAERLLKRKIDEFNPDAVIYDTFFPHDIVKYCCYNDIINILIMRKLKDRFMRGELKQNVYSLFDLLIFPHDEQGIAIPKKIKNKSVYSGAIIRDAEETKNIEKRYNLKKGKFILCAVFGGGGEKRETPVLIKNVLKSFKSIKKEIPEARLILIHGPYCDNKTKINDKDVTIKEFEPNLISLMKKSSLLISQAGYNTINEILYYKIPSIIFPINTLRDDQFERVKIIDKENAGYIIKKFDSEKLKKIICKFYNDENERNRIIRNLKKIEIKRGNKICAETIVRAIERNRGRLQLGNKCNNNCIFCDLTFMRGMIEKSSEEIEKELKRLRERSDFVSFTGGEPTIRKDILELVSYAKMLGFKIIQIQTNGRMLAYKDFCERIIKAGANQFRVYIIKHPQYSHDEMTMVNGSLHETLRGIENLKDLGADVRIDHFFVGYKKHENITVFLRDDDVAKLNSKLRKFVTTLINERIPIHLSIIPKKLSKACARWLGEMSKKYPILIELGQHGYSHKDYGKGHIKYEFGSCRGYKQQRLDIATGKKRLERIFKKRFLIFTPPFHGFNTDTLRIIDETGFSIFSHDKSIVYNNKDYQFKDISTCVNFNRKDENGKWYVPPIKDIIEKIEGMSFPYDKIGILFHHNMFNGKGDFAKLKRLIKILKSKRNIQFKAIGRVI